MKKFLLLIIPFLVFGCTKEDKSLVGEWVNREEDFTKIIYFGEDKHFAYYGDEGSPIGDYDLCESYSLDGNVITLVCDEEIQSDDKININSLSDDELVLEFNGEVVIFSKVK